MARVTSFAAMAYAPKGGGARLVQVAAVEPGYPFYGRIETRARRGLGPAARRRDRRPTRPF